MPRQGFQLNGNPLIYSPVPDFLCWWHSDSSETLLEIQSEKRCPAEGWDLCEHGVQDRLWGQRSSSGRRKRPHEATLGLVAVS